MHNACANNVCSGQPGLQDALERVSGQYTVPNVFIGKTLDSPYKSSRSNFTVGFII